jgi:hypothetical protein
MIGGFAARIEDQVLVDFISPSQAIVDYMYVCHSNTP